MIIKNCDTCKRTVASSGSAQVEAMQRAYGTFCLKCSPYSDLEVAHMMKGGIVARARK